jgi:hypothetical protein
MQNSNEEFAGINGEKYQHKLLLLVFGLIYLYRQAILYQNIGLMQHHSLQNK